MKHPQSVNKSILIREVYEDTFQTGTYLLDSTLYLVYNKSKYKTTNDGA